MVKERSNEEGNKESSYEKQRADRIKENKEKLQKLGIFELSNKLKIVPSSKKKAPTQTHRHPVSSTDPPRRSFRIKDMPSVNYKEQKNHKKLEESEHYKEKRIRKKREESEQEESEEDVVINIEEGENPEFYTEKHENLLGDSKNPWTLYVDGYDEDGQRIYDPHNGKSCHQCRLKTLGQHTECSNCKLFHGQLCGDCLYMRYGENVIEVNENPNWICPVCRGICNCSRCRRGKRYAPIGAIYRKVRRLGYKSVAHYLVKTRLQTDQEDSSTENSPSRKSIVPCAEFADNISASQIDNDKKLKGGECTLLGDDD